MDRDKDNLTLTAETQRKLLGKFLIYKSNLDKLQKNKISDHKLYNTEIIKITYNHQEEVINPILLVDGEIFAASLKVFYELHIETGRLTQESKLQYQLLATDDCISNLKVKEKESDSYPDVILKFSTALEIFFNLKCLVQKSIFVINNFIQQLNALFSENIVLNFSYPSILEDLGDLFENLIVFESILEHSNFKTYFKLYRKSISSVYEPHDDENKLRSLETALSEFEMLLDGNLLQIAFNNVMASGSAFHPKTAIKLQKYIVGFTKNLMQKVQKSDDVVETSCIVKLNVFAIICHLLFGNNDQKLAKSLLEINNKYCGMTLIGSLLFEPDVLLKSHAPHLIKNNRIIQDFQKTQLLALNLKDQNLLKDVTVYSLQVNLWILQVLREKTIGNDRMLQDILKHRCELFLSGVKLAEQISQCVKSVTNLHIKLDTPIPRQCLTQIYQLIEYLKMFKLIFQLLSDFMANSVGFIVQYLQFQALFIVSNARIKLSETSNSKKAEIVSCLKLCEKLLGGPATIDRLFIVCLSFNFSDPINTFGSDGNAKLEKLLLNLRLLIKLQSNIDDLYDPEILYWHQSLLPFFMKQVIDQNSDQKKIVYVIDATADCANDLKSSFSSETMEQFNDLVNDGFENDVIRRLNNYIEINLRLDFHSGLQLEKFNPFDTSNKINIIDRRGLIELPPVKVGQCLMIVKESVEHYLSNLFYNLTTISLHDWKTYGEMRCLAEKKYNLRTVEDHLPNQRLEQGLDVLEIMRNINVFVSKYLYNLNNQIFIEKTSTSKHLNTICIKHIANSLRTHGTGIINTTVNYIYQFLRKKFFIFSQFIYDEQIKSRLARDLKHYRDNFETNKQVYSYERANSFNRSIKNLGLSENNESFLDLFRQLISHIGNAMGYVRMVRSGALNACSNASVFLPALDADLKFVKLTKECNLPTTTQRAAVNLESDLQNLVKNFAEGTQYFKLLVDTFTPFFQDPKNIHLKNFFIIVPPLTINFIEHILSSKEKLTKKNKTGALFTDDGFSIGLIYVLKLLNQTTDYNSLNWFKSIRMKINKEKALILEQRNRIGSDKSLEKADEKLSQTLLLSEKKLAMFQQEFELLFYNISSAKIFFQ